MAGEKLQIEQVGPKEWKFVVPHLPRKLDESFDQGIDLMAGEGGREAEKIFRAVIKSCPSHIDARHHLAMLLYDRGQIIPAMRTWGKAVDIGIRSLPREFLMGKDRLEWGWLDNRPFLRAYQGLGCILCDVGEFDAAQRIFNNILAMNPNDDQGVRGLAIKAAFALGLPDEVLKICNQYKSDCMVDTTYGRALALFQMDRKAPARKALKDAIVLSPLVASELLKKRHTPPKGIALDYVTMGGADEAYYYWQDQGKFWKETQGAFDFLAEVLSHRREKIPTAQVIPFRR
jgi:tetratricopeptide (TPR) repeat protein